jgi:hypothetical protein
MITYLTKLYNWLDKNNFKKLAQEVKDLGSDTEEYAEPWHQEVVEELNKKDEESLKNLEDKYFLNETEFRKNINDYLNNSDYYVPANKINNILKNEGFNTVFQSENIVAGKGAFGIVLKGTYQGKPAVAKVETNYDDYPKETSNWMQILKSKETMPAEYKKHIPNIFKLNLGKYEAEGKNPLYYSVIIMEELFELSVDMKGLLTGNFSALQHVNNLLKDQDFIDSLASKLWNYLKFWMRRYQDEYDITYPSIENISHILSQKDEGNFYFARNKAEKITEEVKGINNITKERADRRWQSINQGLVESTNNLIRSALSTYNFPYNHEAYKDDGVWAAFPETKTFFETLMYIKNNANLSWRDLHTGNVMMDRDGNLKIIDVGLYERNLE